MLKRKAYDKLLKWKHESAGKTALLIEGARRVGKSTLVRTFGETEYKSCLVIDFFQAPAEVKQYFEDYRTDFDRCLKEINDKAGFLSSTCRS